MIEDLIRELIEALKENTAANTAANTATSIIAGTATDIEVVEEVVEEVVAKPKRKPRRTKKQIAEEKAQAELLASESNSLEQVTPPTDAPRMYKGHVVPSGVAVGMEEDCFSVSGLIAVETQPQLTLNDVRTQMTQLAATKGGENVVNCIAKYAARIDLVAPEQYQSLLDAVIACPDINSSAPPPPAA